MNLTTLTDAGLHDLSAQIAAEWDRRRRWLHQWLKTAILKTSNTPFPQ